MVASVGEGVEGGVEEGDVGDAVERSRAQSITVMAVLLPETNLETHLNILRCL